MWSVCCQPWIQSFALDVDNHGHIYVTRFYGGRYIDGPSVRICFEFCPHFTAYHLIDSRLRYIPLIDTAQVLDSQHRCHRCCHLCHRCCHRCHRWKHRWWFQGKTSALFHSKNGANNHPFQCVVSCHVFTIMFWSRTGRQENKLIRWDSSTKPQPRVST